MPLNLEEQLKVYCKDARDMSEVLNKSVDLTVTSPPYFVGKDYEKYLSSLDDYLSLLASVWEQVAQKTKSGGRLVVNIAHSSKYDTPSLVSTQLFQMGWTFIDNIVWEKPSFSPRFGSFVQNPYSTYYVPNTIHERILVFSKGQPNKERKEQLDIEWAKAYRNDIWEIKPQTKDIGHEAPYPVALVEPIILFYSNSGDTILDPFIGSGTTAIACLKNGRKCIGYELEQKYCSLTWSRVKQELGEKG